MVSQTRSITEKKTKAKVVHLSEVQRTKATKRRRIPSSWRLKILRVVASKKKASLRRVEEEVEAARKAQQNVAAKAVRRTYKETKAKKIAQALERSRGQQAEAKRQTEQQQAELEVARVADAARMAEDQAAADVVRRTYEAAKAWRIAKATESAQLQEDRALVRMQQEEADVEIARVGAAGEEAIRKTTTQTDADVCSEPKMISEEVFECTRCEAVVEEGCAHVEETDRVASAATGVDTGRRAEEEGETTRHSEEEVETTRHSEEEVERSRPEREEATAGRREESNVVLVFADENQSAERGEMASDAEAVEVAKEDVDVQTIVEEAIDQSQQEETGTVVANECEQMEREVAGITAEQTEANSGKNCNEEKLSAQASPNPREVGVDGSSVEAEPLSLFSHACGLFGSCALPEQVDGKQDAREEGKTTRHSEEEVERSQPEGVEAIASNHEEANIVVVVVDENQSAEGGEMALDAEAVDFAKEDVDVQTIVEEAIDQSQQEEIGIVVANECEPMECEVAGITAEQTEANSEEGCNEDKLSAQASPNPREVGVDGSSVEVEPLSLFSHACGLFGSCALPEQVDGKQDAHKEEVEVGVSKAEVVARIAKVVAKTPNEGGHSNTTEEHKAASWGVIAQQTTQEEAKSEAACFVEDNVEETRTAEDMAEQPPPEATEATASQEHEEAAANVAQFVTEKAGAAYKGEGEVQSTVEVVSPAEDATRAARITEEEARQQRQEMVANAAHDAALECVCFAEEKAESKMIVGEEVELARLEASEAIVTEAHEQADNEAARVSVLTEEVSKANADAKTETECETMFCAEKEAKAKRISGEAAERTHLEAAEATTRQENDKADDEAACSATKTDVAQKAEAQAVVECEIARLAEEEAEAKKRTAFEFIEQARPKTAVATEKQACEHTDGEATPFALEEAEIAWKEEAAGGVEASLLQLAEEEPKATRTGQEEVEAARPAACTQEPANHEHHTDKTAKESAQDADTIDVEVISEPKAEEGGKATKINTDTCPEAQAVAPSKGDQVHPEVFTGESEVTKRAHGETPTGQDGASHKKARHTSPSTVHGAVTDPYLAEDLEQIEADTTREAPDEPTHKQPLEGDTIADVNISDMKPCEKEAFEHVFAGDRSERVEFLTKPSNKLDVIATEEPLAKTARMESPAFVDGVRASKATFVRGGS